MTISITQGLVGIVAILGALSPLACSSAPAKSGESLGAGQSLLKEGDCINETLGGATSSKPIDTWKDYAAQTCKSRGLALGDFAAGAASKDGVSDVKYSCCKEPPKPLPGSNPSANACFTDAQGGPKTCKSVEDWTKYLNEQCGAKGLKVTDIGFGEECDKGSFRWTKYACCDGSEKTPRPPATCMKTELAGDKRCTPNGDWKLSAVEFCQQQKLALSDLSFRDACGPDASASASVVCCDESGASSPGGATDPSDPKAVPPSDPAPGCYPDCTPPSSDTPEQRDPKEVPPNDPAPGRTPCIGGGEGGGGCTDATK